MVAEDGIEIDVASAVAHSTRAVPIAAPQEPIANVRQVLMRSPRRVGRRSPVPDAV
jgi:hypothetical protein